MEHDITLFSLVIMTPHTQPPQHLIAIVHPDRASGREWLKEGLEEFSNNIVVVDYSPRRFDSEIGDALAKGNHPTALLTTPSSMKAVIKSLLSAREEVLGKFDFPIDIPLPAIGFFDATPQAIRRAQAALCRDELFSILRIKEPDKVSSILDTIYKSKQFADPRLHLKL